MKLDLIINFDLKEHVVNHCFAAVHVIDGGTVRTVSASHAK